MVLVVECLGASTVILYGINLLFVSVVPEHEVISETIKLQVAERKQTFKPISKWEQDDPSFAMQNLPAVRPMLRFSEIGPLVI